MRLFVPKREANGEETELEFIPSADRRMPPAVLIAKLQEERDRLQREFRDFWLHYPDPYFEIDVFSLRVRRLNYLARELFGVTLTDRRRGIDATEIFADDPQWLVNLGQVAGPGKGERTLFSSSQTGKGEVIRFRRRDGSEFDAEVRIAYVVDADGHPLRLRLSLRPLE